MAGPDPDADFEPDQEPLTPFRLRKNALFPVHSLGAFNSLEGTKIAWGRKATRRIQFGLSGTFRGPFRPDSEPASTRAESMLRSVGSKEVSEPHRHDDREGAFVIGGLDLGRRKVAIETQPDFLHLEKAKL